MHESTMMNSTKTMTTTTTSTHMGGVKRRSEDEDREYEDDDGSLRNSRYSLNMSKSSRLGSDIPTVYYSSSSPLPGSHRQGHHSKNSSNLRINEVLSTDFYSFESAESSYHTANEHDETKPIILKQLKALKVLEGDSAVFKCSMMGNPKPVYHWYKDDDLLIKDSPNSIYLEDANNVYKLIIRETTLEDAGLYKFVAQNRYGQADTACTLAVTEGKFSRFYRYFYDITSILFLF